MATDMISTAIIGIATLIIVATLVAALFPQVFQMAGSIKTTAGTADDRLSVRATVVNYDLPAPGQLQFDVLNNGKASLGMPTINMTVVYLNNHSMPANILAAGTSSSAQYWDYALTGNGDGQWGPGEVLEVRVVSPAYNLEPGDYTFKMLLYNGAVVQYGFTIEGR
jgi:archaellum component FlaG (FlaF/FlaG flagellin family)